MAWALLHSVTNGNLHDDVSKVDLGELPFFIHWQLYLYVALPVDDSSKADQ